MHQSHKQLAANTVKVQSRGPVIEIKITLPILLPHELIGICQNQNLNRISIRGITLRVIRVQLIESFNHENASFGAVIDLKFSIHFKKMFPFMHNFF